MEEQLQQGGFIMTEFEDEALRLLREILELLKAQRGAGSR